MRQLTTILLVVISFGSLQAQELPLGDSLAGRRLQPPITSGSKHYTSPLEFHPQELTLGWLQEQVNPIARERRDLQARMAQKAQQSIIERPEGQLLNIEKNIGLWRMNIGNNRSQNWSIFPDRALDARAIRYPMPRNMQLNRGPKK